MHPIMYFATSPSIHLNMRFVINTLILTVVFWYSTNVHAQESSASSSIVYILDASGSMWGKVEGKFKKDIAQSVLTKSVQSLDDDRKIGLVVYGHRTKGDCQDVEWLARPAAGQKDEIIRELESLNPVGMTPLAIAAKQVLASLDSAQESATIILVTDGIETCEGDLCEVVQYAKTAGLEFVLHIVGFDLGDSDKTLLQCAARAGEGLYIDAASSAQLDSALMQTTDLTVEMTEATLSVKSTKEDQLSDALVIINKTGDPDELARLRTYTGETSNPAMFHIPSGSYDIEVRPLGMRGVSSIYFGDVKVSKDEIIERVADFSTGNLSVLVTNNGELHDAVVIVSTNGQTVVTTRSYTSASSNPKVMELNPGTYDVTVRSVTIEGEGFEVTQSGIQVEASQTSECALDIPSGILMVGAKHQGELWDCTIHVSTLSGESVARGRTYTSESSNPKRMVLTPGKYKVTLQPLKLDVGTQTTEIEVRQGGTTEQIFTF